MVKHLKKALCLILAFTMIMTTGLFADCKTYGYSDTESLYDRLSVKLTDAVYDYLDEIYIEKYPALGLRFKYGDEKDRQELLTLANLITEGKTNDMDKARAICRWVKASLTYGSNSPYPIDTLRSRRGVCLNYSLLASQLMRLVGIPSVVVDGNRGDLKTVSMSDLRRSGHAWLYAHINDEWVMFDPLWSAGTPYTKEDKEYLASYYLISTIEGIFITFEGMDLYDVNLFSSGARGDGPIYYQGRFKFVFNGQIDGESYRPTDLGNASYAVNGISQNVTLRCIKEGGIQDGYHYVGDINDERRNQMVAGELYTNGWLTSGNYLYENGVAATGKIETVGDKTLFFDTCVWEINADEDDYWTKDGRVAFRTGTTGYELLKEYDPVPSDEEMICLYSLEPMFSNDDGESTVTQDGYFDLFDPGYYSLSLKYYRAEDHALMGFTSVGIYVEDERPEVDYTAGTIDISGYYVNLSGGPFLYTGEEIKPEVTVEESAFSICGQRTTLTEGEDYTVAYENNILPGYGKVVITGKDIFSGTASTYFYIDHEHVWNDGSDSEIPWNACENEWEKAFTCTLCGETKYETTAPLGHSWGEWVTVNEPTCTAKGTAERVCSVCGKSDWADLPEKGHSWSETYTIDRPATCTATGSESIHCTVCGQIDETTIREIPATGHSLYIEESLSKSPTCMGWGKTVYFCRNCKYSEEEATAPLGHNWGADGTCTRCGEVNNIDGWIRDSDGIWYYYTHGIAATGWKQVGSARYLFDDSGVMLTGWQNVDGTWYYLQSSGAMATGWLNVGGTWYFLNASGAMQTGWVKSGNAWYYLNPSGAMATGWVKVGETWYYMASSGAMQTGWLKVGGTWYFFKSSGAMAASEWVPGYYWISASGAWTYQPKGSWKQDSTGWWFGDTSGWYAKSETIKINDVDYTFDSSGYWVE